MSKEKKYKIIYADPPWAYRNMGNIQATANAHYNTMSQKDIENLPVGGYRLKIVYYFYGRLFLKFKKH